MMIRVWNRDDSDFACMEMGESILFSLLISSFILIARMGVFKLLIGNAPFGACMFLFVYYVIFLTFFLWFLVPLPEAEDKAILTTEFSTIKV